MARTLGFVIAFVLPAVALAQQHDQCWLQYNGWLNSGTNPAIADVVNEIKLAAQEYDIPWEILCTVSYHESGTRQFASDGFLLHNVPECQKNYQKYVLGMAISAPTPPGLGMMQLTGETATQLEPQPWVQERTSWKFNVHAGAHELSWKMSAYLNSTSTPASIKAEVSQYRNVIENWYIALWRYNGYVGNYGTYANTEWGLLKNRPGVLAQMLPQSIPATYPVNVIPHFWDSAYGEAFVARPDGTWTCKHGTNYTGAVHLTSGATAPPPPPPPPPPATIRQVTTSTLNVRTGPGTTYAILGTISQGQKYVGYEQTGGWYHIWYNGSAAWIYGAYTAAASGTAAKVTVTDLNVRTGPSTSYSIVGVVHNGQQYVVAGSSGSWRKIHFKGGTYWVYGPYTASVTY